MRDLDNLDHNPSATTATTSCHDTGISTFQFQSTREPGVIREPVTLPPSRAHTHLLPYHYASVTAVSLKSTGVQVPESNSEPVKLDLADAKREEYDWTEHSLISVMYNCAGRVHLNGLLITSLDNSQHQS